MIQDFKTSDIVLAAALRVRGFPMTSIEITGTKGTFVFGLISKQFLHEYDLGQVLVEPIEFNNAIKQLTTSVRRMSMS